MCQVDQNPRQKVNVPTHTKGTHELQTSRSSGIVKIRCKERPILMLQPGTVFEHETIIHNLLKKENIPMVYPLIKAK